MNKSIEDRLKGIFENIESSFTSGTTERLINSSKANLSAIGLAVVLSAGSSTVMADSAQSNNNSEYDRITKSTQRDEAKKILIDINNYAENEIDSAELAEINQLILPPHLISSLTLNELSRQVSFEVGVIVDTNLDNDNFSEIVLAKNRYNDKFNVSDQLKSDLIPENKDIDQIDLSYQILTDMYNSALDNLTQDEFKGLATSLIQPSYLSEFSENELTLQINYQVAVLKTTSLDDDIVADFRGRNAEYREKFNVDEQLKDTLIKPGMEMAAIEKWKDLRGVDQEEVELTRNTL